MSFIKVTLEDGFEVSFPAGITCQEVLQELKGRNTGAIAALIDGRESDLTTRLDESCRLEFIDFDSPRGARIYRHTASHILAQAVKRLYPGARLGIGPAIDTGFYYDFEFDEPISADDLDRIEKEMNRIIAEDLPLRRLEPSRREIKKVFSKENEPYKLELIEELPEDEIISCYQQGDFIDLCAGPHLTSTGRVNAIKLTGLAGAYWRGDERNPMLQRIYGTAFPTQDQLKEHLHRLEEARKRDHRKLGRELDLFSFQEEGPGFPFFHYPGLIVLQELTQFWREEHHRAGYEEIKTPIILNRQLWENSGHWEHFRENMYFTRIDEQDYAVKPMNCPGAMLVYRTRMHSYRDFPRRIAEMGLVHRHELSGTLHGLMRVRSFTQDDAHIFLLPDQVEAEIKGIIDLVERFYHIFGYKYRVELSTRPEKAMGSTEQWEKATAILKRVLGDREIDYRVNQGEGAFYGPKIDFHLRDCLGREWQCSTIQLDFQMPEKFDLTYIGEDGQRHRPVVIHRVIYGAMERFFALLIEHYAGAFPAWLAPVQVVVIPITERHHGYGRDIYRRLAGRFRVSIDERNEKVGYKIREAQLKKIPYMLIVGDREEESRRVAVRSREDGDLGPFAVDDFVRRLQQELEEKR